MTTTFKESPTEATSLIARCRLLGVTISAAGGALTIRPASAVPPDLLAALKARKPQVLKALLPTWFCNECGEDAYRYVAGPNDLIGKCVTHWATSRTR